MDNTLESVIRALDRTSDVDIIRIAAGPGTSVATSTIVSCRYAGTQKLPPGAPFGLIRKKSGDYNIQHIAIVRVQQKDYLQQAERVIWKSTIKHFAIGIAGGLVAATLTILGWTHWIAPPVVPASPCSVNKILTNGVSCHDGVKESLVKVGDKFPDGRYQLVAVLPGLSGFSAIQINGERNITFQLDAPRHNQGNSNASH